VSDNFLSINSTKANFDEIYVKDDPRAYFSVLGALDYVRHARLDDMVKIGVGRNRPTGPRYVQVPSLDGQQVAIEP
jgi:hypothetical protein